MAPEHRLRDSSLIKKWISPFQDSSIKIQDIPSPQTRVRLNLTQLNLKRFIVTKYFPILEVSIKRSVWSIHLKKQITSHEYRTLDESFINKNVMSNPWRDIKTKTSAALFQVQSWYGHGQVFFVLWCVLRWIN